MKKILWTLAPTLFAASFLTHAQDAAHVAMPPANLKPMVDRFGIDMTSGTTGIGGMAVSIGSSSSSIVSDPGRTRYLQDNHTSTLTEITVKRTGADNETPSFAKGLPIGTFIAVQSAGRMEVFQLSGSSYLNYRGTGGILSCTTTTCTYTDKEGYVSVFDKSKSDGFKSSLTTVNPYLRNIGLRTKLTKPDGEVIDSHYQSVNGYGSHKPSAVVSSLGWMLKYSFGPKVDESYTVGSTVYFKARSTRKITALNTSVEYCNPALNECTFANTWPVSSMEGTSTIGSPPLAQAHELTHNVISSVKNPLGGTDNYSKSTLYMQPTNEGYTDASGIVHSYYSPGGACYNGSCSATTLTGKVQQLTVSGVSIYYSVVGGYSGPDGTVLTNNSTQRPTSFTDKLSRKYTYTYVDSWGEFVNTLTNPDYSYEDYDYDSRKNITKITRYPKSGGATLTVTASYPSSCTNIKTCNKPSSITDEFGVTKTFTYHASSGLVETVVEPSVNGVQAKTTYSYTQKIPKVKNSSGQLIDSTPVWRLTKTSRCMTASSGACLNTADEQVTEYEYTDNNLLLTSKKERNGDSSLSLITTYGYDIYGNMIWSDGPKTGSYDRVYYYYDLMQHQIGVVYSDPDGAGPLLRKAERVAYGNDGKITSIKVGTVSSASLANINAMTAQALTKKSYDTVTGQIALELRYNGATLIGATQYSYDTDFRLECVATRMNLSVVTSLPASACQLSAEGTYGKDRITKYEYDDTGSVTKTLEAVGTVNERTAKETEYRPDNGYVNLVKDGLGNTTFFDYDPHNRIEKINYPNKTNGGIRSTSDYVQNTYTGAHLTSTRLRDGTLVNFSYDEKARLKSKTGAVSESYTYNNFNQVTAITNTTSGVSSQSASKLYNSLGWLLSETTPLGVVKHEYNAFGYKTKLVWPDNFYVTYDYDYGGYVSDYIQSIRNSSSEVIASYSYDNLRNRTKLTRANGVVTSFAYDGIGRMSSQITSGITSGVTEFSESFSYTPSSQVAAKSVVAANTAYIQSPASNSTNTYAVNALNQVTTDAGTSVGYDNRGNMTSHAGTTYTYNANNQLISSTQSGVVTTVNYDAENRLYAVTKSGVATKFMYSGADLIAETNSSNVVTKRFIHGPGLDDPVAHYTGSGSATIYFTHTDNLGSVLGITDASKNVISINSYDEYGMPAAANTGRFQYTGQTWLPELGLYYYKARFYNPKLGRFMQTDPIGYGDGMNWYAYVGNDPINSRDTSGLCTTDANAPTNDICKSASELTTK